MTRTLVRQRGARALSGREMRVVVDAGTRWAWQLEDDLAAVYEAQIIAVYDQAAKLLAARAPVTAAAPPAGWTIPDPDELGLSLREQMDARHARRQSGDDASTAIRADAIRRTTEAGLQVMGIGFDVRNKLVEGVLRDQLGGKITGIRETTRREIMGRLEQSWKAGDSIPRAARSLRDAAPEIAASRSRTIARTELLAAVNGGAHALASLSDETGSVDGLPPLLKIWLTARDEAVRDTHAEAGDAYGAGSGIPMSEPFLVGDSELQFPGDPDGSAGEVINCRCAISYEEADSPAPAATSDVVADSIDANSLISTINLSADSAGVVRSAESAIDAVIQRPVGDPLRAVRSDVALAYDANENTLLVGSDLTPAQAHGVVHEYGHYLDHEVLGDGRFASNSGGASKVLAAIDETSAAKVWEEEASRAFESAPEKFARAFEQWIATRSGNEGMRAAQTAAEHRGVAAYWTEADFARVGRAMDDLFREKGLLAPPAQAESTADLLAQIAREQAFRPEPGTEDVHVTPERAVETPAEMQARMDAEAATHATEQAAITRDLEKAGRERRAAAKAAAGDSAVLVDEAAADWNASRVRGMFDVPALDRLGLDVQASSRDLGFGRISVNAFVGTTDGDSVAEIERTINLREATVHHDSFFIEPAWQGKGLAKDFLRSSVREYDAAGIERVEVSAAGLNGRYTWARFGFDFDHVTQGEFRARFAKRLFQKARAAGVKMPTIEGYDALKAAYPLSPEEAALREAMPQTFARLQAAEHSWEFAGMSVDENGLVDEAFGKNAMLEGPAWGGTLDLAPGSASREVFDAYTR